MVSRTKPSTLKTPDGADVKLGVSFAKHFKLSEDWFAANKIFNPTLDVDSLLFVDPFLLKGSIHSEFRSGVYKSYIKHFKSIYALLRASKTDNDKAWKTALKAFQQSEKRGLSGTCLGYSKRSTRGRAFGPKLARQSLKWADEVIRLGVQDPELFSSLPLFEEKIGPDLISDMIIGIGIDSVIKFNVRILDKIHTELGVRIPLTSSNVAGRPVTLPLNPFSSDEACVLLVPSDVLKHLPILNDARSLREAAEHNSEFRDRVNEHIGEIFKIRTKKEKEHVKKQAMESAEAFQTFLDLLKLLEKTAYDVNRDPFGLVQWRTVGRQIASAVPLEIKDDHSQPRMERLKNVVAIVVNEFKKVVEKNRMSRLFHVDGKPRHERFAQMVFWLVAKSWCEANDLDIAPECDSGAGPVDFKFSDGGDKVVAEVKLSTNSHVVDGFQKQLTAYQESEAAGYAHFVLIDVGGLGQQWNRVQQLYKSDKGFSNTRKIHLIDGTLKESASKLR